MNDIPKCLEKTKLQCAEFTFNLRATDPIESFLDEKAPWNGAGGEFVVTLGSNCGAEPGHDALLPTLDVSVNVLSRMWLGVQPASGLAVTENLSASEELLGQLDLAFRLPTPKRGWPF